jgi:hypothetical protein
VRPYKSVFGCLLFDLQNFTADQLFERNVVPDLAITVNFSKLYGNTTRSPLARENAVSIIPLTTTDIEKLKTTNRGFSLLPGRNVSAAVALSLRSIQANPWLGSLGAFGVRRIDVCNQIAISKTLTTQTTKTILVGNIVDPLLDPSSPFGSTDISTLYLYPALDYTDWNIVQDNFEDTVFSGFAAIGGLWSFFSAVFEILFACSLALLFWSWCHPFFKFESSAYLMYFRIVR